MNRNQFDDKFAEKLASILLSDEYLKSISLQYNRITTEGLRCIAEATCQHSSLLSIDFRFNPCFGYNSD